MDDLDSEMGTKPWSKLIPQNKIQSIGLSSVNFYMNTLNQELQQLLVPLLISNQTNLVSSWKLLQLIPKDGEIWQILQSHVENQIIFFKPLIILMYEQSETMLVTHICMSIEMSSRNLNVPDEVQQLVNSEIAIQWVNPSLGEILSRSKPLFERFFAIANDILVNTNYSLISIKCFGGLFKDIQNHLKYSPHELFPTTFYYFNNLVWFNKHITYDPSKSKVVRLDDSGIEMEILDCLDTFDNENLKKALTILSFNPVWFHRLNASLEKYLIMLKLA